MPIREYSCDKCEKKFDRIEYSNEAPLADCPICDSPIRRLISVPSQPQFKGSGFYATDYKPKKKD